MCFSCESRWNKSDEGLLSRFVGHVRRTKPRVTCPVRRFNMVFGRNGVDLHSLDILYEMDLPEPHSRSQQTLRYRWRGDEGKSDAGYGRSNMFKKVGESDPLISERSSIDFHISLCASISLSSPSLHRTELCRICDAKCERKAFVLTVLKFVTWVYYAFLKFVGDFDCWRDRILICFSWTSQYFTHLK
jgi:hypothetical protein